MAHGINGFGGGPSGISVPVGGIQKTTGIAEYQSLKQDFQHLMVELSRDKQEIIKELDELGITKQSVKRKSDALGWHGRTLNLLSLNQVQEALLLFKKSVLPTDNIDIRNAYIKMRDHGSQAIVILVGNLRAETLQEKMTLRSSTASA